MNIVGKKYGRLTVLEFVGRKGHENIWLCECECGVKKEVANYNLLSGHTKSCGCYNREIKRQIKFKHGLTNTSLYNTWHTMLHRCESKNDPRYKDYGGRGVTVCKEWHDIKTFYKWAVENGYKEGLSIDRIDVNGNYQPSNCRWAERIIQMNNRRNNHFITINGRTETVKNWSRITGISYNVIISRLRRGWSEVDAITFPVSKTRKYEHGA